MGDWWRIASLPCNLTDKPNQNELTLSSSRGGYSKAMYILSNFLCRSWAQTKRDRIHLDPVKLDSVHRDLLFCDSVNAESSWCSRHGVIAGWRGEKLLDFFLVFGDMFCVFWREREVTLPLTSGCSPSLLVRQWCGWHIFQGHKLHVKHIDNWDNYPLCQPLIQGVRQQALSPWQELGNFRRLELDHCHYRYAGKGLRVYGFCNREAPAGSLSWLLTLQGNKPGPEICVANPLDLVIFKQF